MAQDKELEIQLQFLDEAQEYLGTLEIALLGLASSGVDVDKVNSALRAAHSIKGGAGMMGFQTLSDMAHRLEDSFKVLKVQRHSIEIDGALEGLLLRSLDCLRQVIDYDRAHSRAHHPTRSSVSPEWVENYANPIFEALHDRLGDPVAEDANSILSPEEGQDVVLMLFQSEVEGCLERLESVLESESPCLREEVEILAQELGGLGEMLQLPAFTQLCASVAQTITSAPDDRVVEVAQLSLQTWRRSHALVLVGHLEALPNALEGVSFDLPDSDLTTDWPETWTITETEDELTPSWNLSDQALTTEVVEEPIVAVSAEAELASVDSLVDASSVEWETEYPAEPEPALEPLNWMQTEDGLSTVAGMKIADESFDETLEPDFDEPAPEASILPLLQNPVQPIGKTSELVNPAPTQRVTEFRVADIPIESTPAKESHENSVRVPIKQIDQLSDLFGELTIERNGLDLNLKRLRNLVEMLNQRVQVLEQSNAKLRDAYDKVEIHSDVDLPVVDLGSELTPQRYLKERKLQEGQIQERYIKKLTDGSQALKAKTSDSLLGGFDVLEMDRYNDLHLMSQEVMETIVQIQEVTSDIELGLDDTEQTARELNKTSRQLRTKLTQVRMRPLSDVTDRFPRAIRELSLQYKKPVQLQIHGANTLVDRNILEALSDPLMHLLRNAFDHGIEETQTRLDRGKSQQGLIEIRAQHRNNRTIITLHDDGGGIPLDKVRAKARQMGLDEMLLAAASDEELLSLIFEPGFSTSEQVTALSGRGVGMDVVRDRLRQIQGEIKVDTQPGKGTTFTLSMPFTLSVARVLIAESRGMLMAFPIEAIEEMLLLPAEQVLETAGSEAFTWEDSMVQLVRLSQWLNFRRTYQPEDLETQASISVPTVLLLSQGTQLIGLQVDRTWGEQEVAVRKVEGGLPLPFGFSNCTILGDGRVVPLVNVPDLLHWIASCERSQVDANPITSSRLLPASFTFRAEPLPVVERQSTILIIDDSINVRRLLALTLEKAGYQVAQARDGQDAIDKLTAGLQVQAVICDIEMPRLDGYGFLAKVKSTPPLERIPIAMLTSRSGDKHRQLAMNLGASAYFSKPYNEQSLLQTLESLVSLAPAV